MRSSPLVVMVNNTLARRYWPAGNAVGKHITVGLIPTPMEVVGVIGDIRNESSPPTLSLRSTFRLHNFPRHR